MPTKHNSRTLFNVLGVAAIVWGVLCAALGARSLLRAASAGIGAAVIIFTALLVLAGGLCIAAGYLALKRADSPPIRALSAVIAFMFFGLANVATRPLNPGGKGSDWEGGRAFVVSILIPMVSVFLYPVVKRWLREVSRDDPRESAT